MKLGIVCTMINGFGRRGYYNTQEIGLGRELVSQGHSVVIYKAVPKSDDGKVEKIPLDPGLEIWYIPVSAFGAHGYMSEKLLDPAMDAVLCYADNQIFLPHIYRFCKRNHIAFVPYVGRTHSSSGGAHGLVMNTLFHMGTLRIFKKEKTISKIEEVRQELLALGVPDVTVAPVGLDFSVMKKDFRDYDRTELRKEFGFGPDDTVICTVGRVGPEKHPLDLVDIFLEVRKQKPCKLFIVGEGIQSDELKAKVAALNLGDEIRLIDRIPNDQIWKVYASADYFVNLCHSEIFGMAILEAMYYGVSVAATPAPGPNVTLQDMPGHKLCKDYGEVIQWLSAPKPAEADLRESAERTVRRYNWGPCANIFLNIVAQQKA